MALTSKMTNVKAHTRLKWLKVIFSVVSYWPLSTIICSSILKGRPSVSKKNLVENFFLIVFCSPACFAWNSIKRKPLWCLMKNWCAGSKSKTWSRIMYHLHSATKETQLLLLFSLYKKSERMDSSLTWPQESSFPSFVRGKGGLRAERLSRKTNSNFHLGQAKVAFEITFFTPLI